MTLEELKELAKYAAKNEAPTNFSVDNVDEALADGLRDLAGSINQFMKNRLKKKASKKKSKLKIRISSLKQ